MTVRAKFDLDVVDALKAVVCRCIGFGVPPGIPPPAPWTNEEIASTVVIELAGRPVGDVATRGAVEFLKRCLDIEINPFDQHAWAAALGYARFELWESRKENAALKQTVEALQSAKN